MKKIFIMAAAVVLSLTSCAQDSVPATPMTMNEVQKAITPIFDEIGKISPDDPQSEEKVCALCKKFADENHNEAGVYIIRNLLGNLMQKDELIKYIDSVEFFKNDSSIMESRKMWNVQVETGAGKMFKDFSAEYNGKTTRLSDYVGKGKYVLVDFWASWCGPCKREIPNLIKIYEQYKGEKFEVLGVATWDKPDATLASIEQLGITYPQMINAQKAGSDAYGIEGIPEIILFAPDGTIVARGLRGHKINDAVEAALK